MIPIRSGAANYREVLECSCSVGLLRRVDGFRLPLWIFCLYLGSALLLFAFSCSAQRQSDRPSPLDPAQGERNARELIAETLSQKPEQNSSKDAVLKIRDAKDVEKEVPVHIDVRLTPTNWSTVYETKSSPAERLEVVHTDEKPNQYQLTDSSKSSAPKTLSADELMRPFAGSDFWTADLGLEFLHWPKQRVLMNDMRHHKSCSILESTNPQPAAGGYAKVMSWITVDTPHVVVHAEAFDSSNQIVKKFDPKNLEKINGQYELESMEIRSPKVGSRTILEFDLK